MTPSDTAHPEGERELLPCPFCGLRLERSEAFSNRTRNVYVHPQQPDEAYPCPAYDYRVADNDPQRLAAWNTRPVVRPQGEEGLDRKSLKVGDKLWIAVEVFEIDGAGDAWMHRPAAKWDPMRLLPSDEAALSNQGKPSS